MMKSVKSMSHHILGLGVSRLLQKLSCFVLVLITVVSSGCATMSVHRDVVNKDGNTVSSALKGVPYYLPKAYIVVEEECNPPTADKADPKANSVNSKTYDVSIKYLPDLKAGKHYISVKPWLGSAEGDFKIEDGWRLTSVNVKLDTKFSDNVKAATDLLGAGATGGAAGNSGLLELAKLIVPLVFGQEKSFIAAECSPRLCVYTFDENNAFVKVDGLSDSTCP